MEQQAEAERNRYRNMMISLSGELVEWLKEKDLTISEFENLVAFIKQSFEASYGKIRIKNISKK